MRFGSAWFGLASHWICRRHVIISCQAALNGWRDFVNPFDIFIFRALLFLCFNGRNVLLISNENENEFSVRKHVHHRIACHWQMYPRSWTQFSAHLTQTQIHLKEKKTTKQQHTNQTYIHFCRQIVWFLSFYSFLVFIDTHKFIRRTMKVSCLLLTTINANYAFLIVRLN